MQTKNGCYEAGTVTVLDDAPEHENAVELLKLSLANGDGSKP